MSALLQPRPPQPAALQQIRRKNWSLGGGWRVVREAAAALVPQSDAWSAFQPQQHAPGRWWAGLAGLWGLQLLLLLVTWGRWPDLIIDFGRELYVPWQMSEGRVLYRDLAYFNGPLSPLCHAALFRCFGADFRVLVATNSLVLAGVVALLYFNLTRLFSLRTSLATLCVFLLLFAYGHTYGIGNFNFLSPYSHEMTHGFALCLAALTALTAVRADGLRGLLVGICCGAIVLTKPEMAVAVGLLVSASFAARIAFRAESPRSLVREGVALLLGGVASGLSIVGWLAVHQGGWDRCWIDALGAWKWLVNSRVSGLHFYRSISGLDAPGVHFARAISGVGGLVLLLIASRRFAEASAGQRKILLGLGIAGGAMLACFTPLVLKNMQAGGILLLALLMAVPHSIRTRHFTQWHLAICWTVLGLGLLIKMILYPRVDGYGFTLAAMLVVVGIAVSLEWIPRLFYTAPHRNLVRAGLVGLLAIDVGVIGAISQIRLGSKHYDLGLGGQSLHSYECIGPIVRETLDYLDAHVGVDQTILALPEGVMLNYLSERRSPTRFYNFMPPELEMFGEASILSELSRNPPDVILLVRRVVYEYGHQRFGSEGYGASILEWAETHYEIERTIGADPMGDGDFGIAILRPRPAIANR